DGDNAHDQRGHHCRMSLIANEGKNVKVKAGDADMRHAECNDDEPKSRSAERFAAGPSDVVRGARTRFGFSGFTPGFFLRDRSAVRQKAHIFRTPAHEKESRADDQCKSNEAEDNPRAAPS